MADFLTNVRIESADGVLICESVSVDLTDYDLPAPLSENALAMWPLLFWYEGRLFALCCHDEPYARPIGIPTATRTK
jgi:hypothetical protein